jgi:6-phosphofructokinase
MDATGKIEDDGGRRQAGRLRSCTQLSGTGALADLLAAALKIHMFKQDRQEAPLRADTLGYAQRSFAGVRQPEIDALEARESGRAAVRAGVTAAHEERVDHPASRLPSSTTASTSAIASFAPARGRLRRELSRKA